MQGMLTRHLQRNQVLCHGVKQFVTSNPLFSSAAPAASAEPAHIIETHAQQDVPEDKLYKTVELEMRGNDPAVLKSFTQFATATGNHLNLKNKSWTLRKPLHERMTVLKSAHIYKKHRVQYEFRTYFSFVQYKHLTGSTADTVLEYVERNLPEGVALKVTKVELQKLPEHFTPPGREN